MKDWIKEPWNIIGAALILIGTGGVIGVYATTDVSASGAGFSFVGHGSYILIGVGCFLCENPISNWLFKRNQTEPPKTP